MSARSVPRPADGWLGLGSELLQGLGRDPGQFSRHVVSDFLQPSCVDVAVEELHARLESGRFAEETEQERGARLGIDRVTIYRWRPGHPKGSRPRLDKYLTAALSLKLGIPGLSYSAWAIRVAKETMCRIDRELFHGKSTPLEDQHFFAVHLFVGDPESFPLFTAQDATSREQIRNVYARLLERLRQKIPTTSIATTQQVSDLINRWLRPYLLFLRAMADAQWEFLHDELG